MENKQYLVLGVVVLLAAAGVGYLALRPAPSTAPGATDTAFLTGGSYTEHAPYYDIAANYASSTPLSGAANVAAVEAMKSFVAETMTQFKTAGNFTNLTAADVKTLGFDQGRKEKLQILYLMSSSAHTVSYIFTVYTDTLGAHGNTTFTTFVFDKATGARLALADLFTPDSGYLERLSALARATLPANLGDAYNPQMLTDGTVPTEANFAAFFLDNTTLDILFAPYAVAPYSAGPQTLQVLASDLANVLNPSYP